MDERPDKQLIADLIARAQTPATAGTGDFVATLTARCWPNGGDNRNAIAAEWLRRWQPKSATLALPQCGCATGRCEACN